MGAWIGEWNLNLASADYADFKVGKFSLKKVPDQPGKFEVTTSGGAAAAKWLGSTFEIVTGSGKPMLPWPLPESPTPSHKVNAGRFLRREIDRQQQLFDCLKGQVVVGGVSQIVHLFKVDKATVGDEDFLICVSKNDLDGGVSPGGSAHGVRP